jgi:NAD+ synthase (glutamine-hydrolysing)
MDKDLSGIIAVTMPGFGTTGKTYNNSLKLIQSLGVTCKTIPIADSVNCHFKDIGHDSTALDVTYENAQARMRTMILMDLANQTGGIVIGTGDLSEGALGWSTYNGDHMSMYAVNCSVPKTLVKHLVGYEAERLGGESKQVLIDILNTEISPELLPP